MSDNDFEIVDSSTIEFASRSRKPKYKHKHWERDDAEGMYIYYKGLQRSYQRRHGVTETPFDHMIDQRMDYSKWWGQNSISLISIEQIRLEGENKVSTQIGDMYVCRYCSNLYDGSEAVYSWVCVDCMETEDYLKDM